jgi:hypothetical protein
VRPVRRVRGGGVLSHAAEARSLLRDAADLLRAKGGWTQGTSARDALGRAVSSLDETAACFCAMGAIARAGDRLSCDSATRDAAVAALRVAIGIDHGIASWNDDESRALPDVLAAFDRAADLAGAQ